MNMNPTIAGAVKSKTVWAAIAIELISNVAPLLPSFFALLDLSPHTVQVVGGAIGIVMVILRTLTNSSLAGKVSPDAAVPPPSGATQ